MTIRTKQADLDNSEKSRADEAARAAAVEREAYAQHETDAEYIRRLEASDACRFDPFDGIRNGAGAGSGSAPRISRQLPPAPDKLGKPARVPHLDTQCFFPWYGVAGCKGKDTRAMLRLTVSDNLALRSQVSVLPAWYKGVRQNYGVR